MKAVVLLLLVLICTMELTQFTSADEFQDEDEHVVLQPEEVERRDAQDFENEDTEFLE